MQDRTTPCQVDTVPRRHVGPTATPPGDPRTADTPPPGDGFVQVFDYSSSVGKASGPLVDTAHQWASTTPSRIVTDPYSWMQAVHWVHGAGIYQPSRSHGPRWGATTLRLAQILARLSPCRPGIDYLTRALGCSERTVQYHLDMLREAGLLAYWERGTRYRTADGRRPESRASSYAWTVPPEFDTALGIRCTPGGAERRPVGIAEHGRELIARLARKAARKPRRNRTKTRPAGRARCTPMEGGSVLPSLDPVPTSVPQETSPGKTNHPTETSDSSSGARTGRRVLNTVGRRFTMAGELVRRIPWLGRANTARIAWQVREVSDAGWSVEEVEAWLQLSPTPDRITRPSGFLGHRLRGATTVWADPQGRARALETTRDTRGAERARHLEMADMWDAPSDPGIVVSLLAGLDHGRAVLSRRCRENGLDDLTGHPAPPRQAATPADEWEDATRVFSAFLGYDVRELVEGARP